MPDFYGFSLLLLLLSSPSCFSLPWLSFLASMVSPACQVAKTMGFGAKKMWNAINKGVGGAVVPSDEALENLHELAKYLATPFSPT